MVFWYRCAECVRAIKSCTQFCTRTFRDRYELWQIPSITALSFVFLQHKVFLSFNIIFTKQFLWFFANFCYDSNVNRFLLLFVVASSTTHETRLFTPTERQSKCFECQLSIQQTTYIHLITSSLSSSLWLS